MSDQCGHKKKWRKNETCVTTSEPNFANIGFGALLLVVVSAFSVTVPRVHQERRAPLVKCKSMTEKAHGGIGCREWELARDKADRADRIPTWRVIV
jgi:hypothetical protein